MLKAPKKLKHDLRAEIHQMILTGNYKRMAHVKGIIQYITYIESGNNDGEGLYLDNIKKYIDKIGCKIDVFPELVEAFNANPFFEGQPSLSLVSPDEEDLNYIISVRLARDDFFRAHRELSRYHIPDEFFEEHDLSADGDGLPF